MLMTKVSLIVGTSIHLPFNFNCNPEFRVVGVKLLRNHSLYAHRLVVDRILVRGSFQGNIALVVLILDIEIFVKKIWLKV